MRFRRSDFARWLSVAMAIMLLFSYGWTGTGNAMSNADSKSNVSRQLYTSVQPENKINQDLKKNFKKHDQVTFLLKFKDQVNTKKVAENALSAKQKKNMTTAKAELTKRSVIVSALRSKAQQTQYNVKDFLNKQKKQGNVKKYHSYFIVNMMAVTGTKKVAERLSKMNEIEKILPNRTRHIIKQPKKVKKAVNSAVKKAKNKEETSDDPVEPNIRHIGAPEAWNMGVDGTGVVVGSIDTGVQWDHPALKKKYRGYDPDHPDNPNNEMNWFDATGFSFGEDPEDSVGHGTHTVGTMLGSEPDGSNQIGVAPGAKWIAVKAFSILGGTDADLLEAGEWMLAPKDANGNPHPEMAPDVINNSWGGGAGIDEFYRDMVKNWRAAGIFPVFAAGNTTSTNPGGPGSVASPGNYPESFAVGATDNNDQLADFSLRGPSPYDKIKPDIAAPGVDIRSSVPGDIYDDTYSGTSMAAPAVAGTLALLKQVNSSLSVDDLEKILIDTAKPLTDDEYSDSPNNGYGHGGLRADDAVESIISGIGEVKGKVTKNGEANEPVSATITVTETGASTKTDPSDGSYSLKLPEGNYTLETEAYGFQSDTKKVEITENETIIKNFSLQEIAKGTLEGTITNKQTGDPVKGATVSLMEDAAVKPVQTDQDGHYSLEAYKGDYTVHVYAPDYYTKDFEVTVKGNATTTKDVRLKPFIGTPGKEIAYDDGTAENAQAWNSAGNRWAVRMSLSEGHDSARITGGKFKFANADFPDPGGDKFQVEIWDASGKDGAPGEKLIGPVDATAVRDIDKWTKVDLKDEGIVVKGDFYMVYLQSEDGDKSPGLASDQSSPDSHRNWSYSHNKWSKDFGDNNYMIRAVVDYKTQAPEITSPKDGSFTNQSTMTVKGKAAPDYDIELLDNGKKIATTSTDGDGLFSKDIELSKGKNKLTAIASTDIGTSEPSQPVTVTLDQDKPDLTISSPENRMKTKKMVVKVKGTVADTNLSWVKINGQKANVNDDGNYSKRIILDNSKNKIKVVARDKANNRTKKTRTVFANFEAPTISNLKPDTDKHLNAGQSVIISFDSDPDLDASFKLHLPLDNMKTTMSKTSSIDELPMMETTPGHYVGIWTATTMSNVNGAEIQVIAKDEYGNVSKKEADGKLYINE